MGNLAAVAHHPGQLHRPSAEEPRYNLACNFDLCSEKSERIRETIEPRCFSMRDGPNVSVDEVSPFSGLEELGPDRTEGRPTKAARKVSAAGYLSDPTTGRDLPSVAL